MHVFRRQTAISFNQNSFSTGYPTSRPPTKEYDRLSYVLVVSKNDDILKFMKMHLNRYFSHVVVSKSYSEAYSLLKEKEFDVLIVEATHEIKATTDFIKKTGHHKRYTPVVVIDPALEIKPNEFAQSLVVDVIAPPFELDSLHIAIRRSLNLRVNLRALHLELSSKFNLADLIRNPEQIPEEHAYASEIVNKIILNLTEEIID